jgi:hypothetical protein
MTFTLGTGVGPSIAETGVLLVQRVDARVTNLGIARLSLGVSGAFPWTTGTISASEGDAAIETRTLGGVVLYRLTTARSWTVDAGVGLSYAWIDVRGSAKPGFVSNEGTTHSAYAFLVGEGSYRLSRTFRIGAELDVGLLTPRVDVRFANRTASEVCRACGAALAKVWVDL